MSNTDTMGKRIRHERQSQGMTLDDLAAKAELSKGFLSDLENDKRDVSTGNLIAIADALETSLMWLARGEKRAKVFRCPLCKGSGKMRL